MGTETGYITIIPLAVVLLLSIHQFIDLSIKEWSKMHSGCGGRRMSVCWAPTVCPAEGAWMGI